MRRKLSNQSWRYLWLLGSLVFMGSKGFAVNAKASLLFQQDTSQVTAVTFTVLDESDAIISKVTLTNTRLQQSSVTDSIGIAKLVAINDDVVRLSINGAFLQQYVVSGVKNQVIRVSSKNPLVLSIRQVVLTNDIRVPFNQTAASTQTIYNNELIKNPVTSVRNAVTGRLAGVRTNQTSGRPGNDEVNLLLRGQNPLILVDGIPRELGLIDLEEIESVTVLKDAVSTAMLGIRSSNGVLAITTKKGIAGKQQISLTAQAGLQTPIKRTKVLDAYNYATLYNEALVNGGGSPLYTAADLEAYRTGSNPISRPNVNWQDEVLKKNSLFQRYDLSIRGGGNVARYYVGLEYQKQQGQFKESDINQYSTNNDFRNYAVRSNVDVNLTPKTLLGIHLFGRIIDSSQPGARTDSIFRNILYTPNNAYPIFNSNGSYGGNTQFQNNIYAQTVNSGYRSNYRRDIITDLSLRQNLESFTKGLWAQALISFYSGLSENTDRSKSFAVYNQITGTTGTTYQLYGTNGTQNNTTSTDFQNRQTYIEGALGYKRDFGKHLIDAQVRYTNDNFFNGSDLSLNYYGGSGRASYTYDERYTAEFAFGLNKTNRYPKGTPLGFFPAAGLTWNISKEKFMPQTSWLNDLKLFASYGRTGNDNSGYFVYQQLYVGSPAGYTFGIGASGASALRQGTLAYPGITWEKANKLNVGLKANLIQNKLFAQVEYFNNKYFDLLTSPNLSSMVGTTVRNQNIGSNRYDGFELQLNWQQTVKEFSYYISANASTLQSEILFQNEEFRPYAYQSRTGLPVGQTFGYIADGLFQNQAQINSSAKIAGYTPVPGDIKYKDLNNDGVIDQFDQAKLGTSRPLIYYGVTLGFAYAGFDFSALVQGVANRNLLLVGNSEWEFQNNGFGQAYEHHLDRWTPATATTASYPRLTVGNNFNNDIVSSFWMHNGNYLRLKNVEIGYTLPKRLTQKANVAGIRIFINATNALIWSAFDRVDPETYGGVYPIQRIINGGLNVKF